jgi:DNA-binding CsgD family transcriptional regulator
VLAWEVRGREREEAILDQVADAAVRGTGATALLEGAAGIGKTRLVTDALARAERRGLATSYASCEEIDAMAPLSPLLRAISSGREPLVDRSELRVLERPGDQRFWLLEELSERLELRSRERPRVIAFDDVQWADPVTAWAIQGLASRTAGLPVAWIVAYRPHALAPAAQRLLKTLTDGGAEHVALAPLGSADVEAIAAEVLGASPDDSTRKALADAGGNPFLTLEVLRALEANHAIPTHFREIVRQRLTGLSPETIRALRAAAVLGRPCSASEVADLLELSAGSLVAALDEALAADVLVDVEGRLEFLHDLIRQAIVDDTPPSVRVVLQRQAATMVLTRGGSRQEAVGYLLESAQPGDDEAVRMLFGAAVEIAPQAPSAAADLAVRALELMPSSQPGWSGIVVGAVGLLAWATRFAEANELAERARRRGLDTEADVAMRLAIADVLLLSARRLELKALCREALRQPLSDDVRCHFLANLGQALVTDSEVEAAREAFEGGLAVAGPEQATRMLAVEVGLAHVDHISGNIVSALTRTEALVQVCDLHGPEARRYMPRLLLAAILCSVDRSDDANIVFAECRRDADELGATWAHEFGQRIVTMARWWAGRLPDAAAEAEATLALTASLGLGHDDDVPLGVLALVAIHADDLAAARRHLDRAATSGHHFARPSAQQLLLAEALLADASGDRAGARSAVDRLTTPREALVQAFVYEPDMGARYARLAGDAPDLVARIVDASDEVTAKNPTLAGHQAAGLHLHALLAGDVDGLVAAAEAYRPVPRLLARGFAMEDAGVALLATGTAADGRRYLSEAAEVYGAAGAARDEQRVLAALRAAGLRRRRTSQPATGGNPTLATLTTAELRVVRLVVEGLTNRQIGERLFLSPYTVSTHLKHVFDKLQVSSRVELTRLAVGAG